MSETTWFKQILDHPIIVKELKSKMRDWKSVILLTAYLLLTSFLISIIYLFATADGMDILFGAPGTLQIIGKIIFGAAVMLEFSIISFIAPALTSGAISSERERKTFDLLRVSPLSATSLVLGKLSVATSYLLLLIFTALPIQSLAFFFGGVGLAEIIISALMLAVTAVFFCALGMFFSSFSKRALISTTLSYASILFFNAFFSTSSSGLGMILTPIFSPSSPSASNSPILNKIAFAVSWILLSTDPFFAAVVSEVILVTDQSAFFISGGAGLLGGIFPFSLPSPWIIYVASRIVGSFLLVAASIFFVSRPEK